MPELFVTMQQMTELWYEFRRWVSNITVMFFHYETEESARKQYISCLFQWDRIG